VARIAACWITGLASPRTPHGEIKMDTAWAILLTKFSDDDTEPYDLSRYEEIFTTKGAGRWNMVDFFKDVSHGQLDLSGSKVFGWNTLTQKHSDYTGSGANPSGRAELIQWARQAVIDSGEKLDDFFAVVVVMNVETDLFGGPQGVVCFDDGKRLTASNLSVAILGQEMGHTYLLEHSRLIGSQNDYGDAFDVMSAWVTETAPHPDYLEVTIPTGEPVFQIGPSLNAANMDSVGWLDNTRVWKDHGGAVNASVQLRPLHQRDLPGYLAARFGDYYVEFRGGEGWDAGFSPAVFVHILEDERSYLVPDDAGSTTLGIGSVISTPEELSVLGSGSRLSVSDIDLEKRTATIHFSRVPPQIPREWPKSGPYLTPWVKWVPIADHQSSIAIGGRDVMVEPGSVGHRILESLFLYQSADLAHDGRFARAIKLEALRQIVERTTVEIERSRFQSPAERNLRSRLRTTAPGKSRQLPES